MIKDNRPSDLPRSLLPHTMETRLSRFCQEFEATARPLVDPLQRLVEALATAPDSLPGKQLFPGLQECRHKLTVLLEKVAEQQAYVLIFGPLKSGKSTLMNALTGAYVSEVTVLPAYPCLVYVSHSDTKEYRITRYNGATESLVDPNVLEDRIHEAHVDLATRLRQSEASGEPFDASRNLFDAIRRLDVKVPAGALRKSGAVLVDTPGLYSRMKFGYDQMTRDFRDTAACAMFVVKTDNLFLEQVFEEFQELLNLFSRIFLIVNLDTTKRDLCPDGSLAPSLESRDPQQILQAFEDLAMSGPLKSALEDGRLRMVPVDLLRAASYRLQERSEAERNHAAVDPEAGPSALDGNEPEDFRNFFAEFSEYLNSPDYLLAFLRDSVRYTTSLLGEIEELASHSDIQELDTKKRAVEDELTYEQEFNEALARIEEHDWPGALEALKGSYGERLEARRTELTRQSLDEVAKTVDAWFQADESLAQLVERTEEVSHRLRVDAVKAARECLSDVIPELPTPAGEKMSLALAKADLQVHPLAHATLENLDSESLLRAEPVAIPYDNIPIRKQLWDWVLFRRQASLRARLFGPAAQPDHAIPAADKEKTLGAPAHEYLSDLFSTHNRECARTVFDRRLPRFFTQFAEKIHEEISDRSTRERRSSSGRVAVHKGELHEYSTLSEAWRELALAERATSAGLDQLAQRHDVEVPAATTVQPSQSAAPRTAGEPELETTRRIDVPENHADPGESELEFGTDLLTDER